MGDIVSLLTSAGQWGGTRTSPPHCDGMLLIVCDDDGLASKVERRLAFRGAELVLRLVIVGAQGRGAPRTARGHAEDRSENHQSLDRHMTSSLGLASAGRSGSSRRQARRS